MPLRKNSTVALAVLTALFGSAHAKDYYISLSGGLSLLGDSDNEGAFDGAFTTGEGTAIPAGTVLPDGTPVGWRSDFDTGYSVSGAVGKRFGPVRGELELSYQKNGVGTHTGVTAGGIALADEDAGVLITGSPNIGVTVADLVADGQGDLSATYLMANAYYDFGSGPLKPFIGGGIGIGFVDVDYSPSGVVIIRDDATEFAYQGVAGIAYEVSSSLDLLIAYRYRATTDVSVQADLFSAGFDVENRSSIVEAGLRVNF